MEKNNELTPEQMADAILADWGKPNRNQVLPSKFQIGDKVNLNFYRCGNLYGGEVVKVHFAPGKVLYDIELPVRSDPSTEETEKIINYTRLYNVDSAFVEPQEPTSEPA